MPLDKEIQKRNASRGQAQGAAAAPAGTRVNPVIDAKLNEFIAENKELKTYFDDLPKEQLVRKLMLQKMGQNEHRQKVDSGIREWVNARPDVKARIAARMENTPAEKVGLVFKTLAQKEMTTETLRVHRMTP